MPMNWEWMQDVNNVVKFIKKNINNMTKKEKVNSGFLIVGWFLLITVVTMLILQK